ncbi:hypothetical protein [Hyphomicrobium sp.]|uniref:hypothetical protein n=1 Tax=Hyphomicrobium sp. TaxID=82 RepID=UPI002E317484|nr:hypothetical protein [Hyphomicrobium sp.]HEX2841071.1 hypothetical protein [Hyphomicrobium sp.]
MAYGVASNIALGALLVSLLSVPATADERFIAKLHPLNADKIGTSANGTATLEIADGTLSVVIDLAGLPTGLMHLQHFHGFPDGKDAVCPGATADTNGDGYIDLIETEPLAGTTMVPFHAHPATLEIPSDSYPQADKDGKAHYQKGELVADLEKALKDKFKAPVLALDKRVIFVHGVKSTPPLPSTVKSLPGVPAEVTLPIACGEIEPVK